MLRLVPILILVLAVTQPPVSTSPYAQNIIRAQQYLLSRLNPKLGLIYESDDPGTHWLTAEYPGFHWRYNETYWLYSDNLFAYLALQESYPQVSNEINASITRYHEPPSGVFEVIAGERIQLPLHAAEDYIVANNTNYVIMIRRHNATALAFNWMDLWMYEALEYDLQGNYASATFLLRRAETMWRGNGFWEFTSLVTQRFSNHKLALFLFTARALGIEVPEEDAMIRHLWSMQGVDGGVTSLSDFSGQPIGSANTETTALTLLIYDQALLAKFPKANMPNAEQSGSVLAAIVTLALLLSVALWTKKRLRVERSEKRYAHHIRIARAP